MITLFLLLMAICVIGIIALCVAGLLVVAWPLAIILGLGVCIDLLVIKNLIKKK